MEINENVMFNILKDWQKRDISPYDKGVMIKAYIEENNISQRELAKKLDISHTTLQTWVSFAKNFKEGQYETLVKAGVPKEDIYKAARAKYRGISNNPLDIILSKVLYVIEKKPAVNNKTKELAKNVIKELEQIIEAPNNNGNGNGNSNQK